MLVERAYAKLNLTLDVLGRRDDGYHEVDMVMQSIDLSDLVWVGANRSGTGTSSIHISSSSLQMPLDERNLAYVAAEAFLKRIPLQRRGPLAVEIEIEKHIPVAAGMAGGSADAAAVLRGLNRILHTGMSLDELADIGASIGSDVPFCVYNGCAIARGRGEILESVSHECRAWAIVVRPPVFISTPDVYHALQPGDFTTDPLSRAMVELLQQGDFSRILQHITNGMSRAAEALHPEVRAYRERMEATISQPVFMSGSGPTLFTLAPSLRRAQRMVNALRGFIREVYLCRFV